MAFYQECKQLVFAFITKESQINVIGVNVTDLGHCTLSTLNESSLSQDFRSQNDLQMIVYKGKPTFCIYNIRMEIYDILENKWNRTELVVENGDQELLEATIITAGDALFCLG